MSDKKNIDRLFQEKFKDFEVEPNEQIWLNIDAALREKKKRRVIPFWFKLTGIAAGLILGFFAFNFLFDDATSVENNPVVIETKKQSNENSTLKSLEKEEVVNTENSSENNTDNSIENHVNPSTDQKTNGINSSEKTNDDAIVNQSKSSKNKSGEVNSEASLEQNNAVATISTEVKKSPAKKKSVRNSVNNSAEAIVNNASKTEKNRKESVNKNAISNNDVNAIANNSKNEKNKKDLQTNSIKDINSNLNTEEKNAIANGISDQEKSNSSIASNQKSIEGQNIHLDNSFIDGTKTDVKKKDSTALALSEPNALEELLKKNEKEEEKIAESKKNRWQITSSVAPIFFNSTSNGSPIDGQFADNNKSYENNMSFGVGVNYAVNKKLTVRTGVNKFTLGYNTNDVVFFAAMDQVSFGNLTSSTAGSTIQVVSLNNSEALRPFNNGIQNTNQGTMTQRMGYYEVPVEMSYKLIDKKFGINVIGGLSTLFLNENEVSVASSTMSASLGKAKNLNDIHFSTNVGLGFRYRFWKSFEANFEPMFKYQINTFNKDAGNFKPYFIGLYSGVSFNF
ncbi:hypothetical protein ACI6PS_04170 [Flavobacterium sp. PLA-1-15]|uniref:hypothetical protein n=1 Tax=Flavobacterium sp. PLA-1-15 TaxID=3380533 RepID=UPI003B80AB85